MKKQVSIGLLQAGFVADALKGEFGDYKVFFDQLFDSYGDVTAYHVYENHFPRSFKDHDLWVISGSAAGVYESHSWIPELENFIRQLYHAKTPTIGICFGHQIMAQALGGKVKKFSGGWVLGAQEYQILDNSTGFFDSNKITLNAIHQDQIIDLPSTAKVIATSDICQYAALSYGSHMFSCQPHPEFDSSYTNRLVDHLYQHNRIEMLCSYKCQENLRIKKKLTKRIVENIM